ncbi:MAG: type II secretion system protein GspN [bacterium]
MSEKNSFSIKAIVSLFIYTLVLFIFFFYILFPFKLLENKIKSLIVEKMKGKAAISSLKIQFPLQLIIKGFHYREGNKKVTIDTITGRLAALKILTGTIEGLFSIDAYEGLISGKLSQNLLKKRKRNVSCTIEKLNLGKVALLSELFGLTLSAEIAGNLKSAWQGTNLKSLNGEWNFSTGSGSCKPRNFPIINFDLLEATGLFRSGIVHIKNIKAESKDILVTARGEVSLNADLPQSQVDLKVTLKIGREFKKLLGVFASFLPKESKDGNIYLSVTGAANNLHYSAR